MGLRKGISLLLLAAFGLSNLAPANAAITLNDGTITSAIAPDSGSAANGAKADVTMADITVDVNGNNDLVFTFGTFANANAANDLFLEQDGSVDTTGVAGTAASEITVTGGDLATTYITLPTGCKFIKLAGYEEVTDDNTGTGVAVDSGVLTSDANGTINVDINSVPGALPDGNTDTNVIAAQVLEATAAGNASVPAGSVAIVSFTEDDATNFNSGTFEFSLENIGIACDAGATLTGTELQATIVQPNVAGFDDFLVGATDGTAFDVANIVAANTKLTVSQDSEPDAQSNVLVESQIPDATTTLTFGPGGITSGTNAVIDTDAIQIKAANVPGSTTEFFGTPFATAEFKPAANVNAAATTSAVTEASLTADGTLFSNVSNALITVEFELQDSNGTALTSPTLRVDDVFVGVPNAILGAAAFGVENDAGTAVANADGSHLVLKDTDGTDTNLEIVDGFNRDNTSFTANNAGGAAEAGLIKADGDNGATVTAQNDDDSAITSVDSLYDSFIFPGVDVAFADDTGNIVAVNAITDVNDFTTAADADYADDEAIRNVNAVYLPLTGGATITTAKPAYLVVEEGATDAGNITLGATDSTDDSDGNALVVDNAANTKNNVVLAASLTKTGNTYTANILPFLNRYDNNTTADMLSVRVAGVIESLSAANKANGLKLVAKISGNNIDGTLTQTMFEVLPEGGVNSALTVSTLPIAGDFSGIMVHSNTDETASRAIVTFTNIDSLDGSTTSLDELSDLVGTGLEVDDTLAPLFTGGKVGIASATASSRRGPVPHIQTEARAVVVSETAAGDFEAIEALGNTAAAGEIVLRFVMPTGVDLFAPDDGDNDGNALDLIEVRSTGTRNSAPTVERVQPIGLSAEDGTSLVTNAYVDVAIDTTEATNGTKAIEQIMLVFKPGALVVTEATVDPTVTVSVVDISTALFTDDVVLSTIGTTTLGTVAEFLDVKFAQNAISTYRDNSTTFSADNQEVSSVLVDNYGAQQSTFASDFSQTKRLVTSSGAPGTTELWNIEVMEQVADAIPLGTAADGVVSNFLGNGAGTVELTCVSSNEAITFTDADNDRDVLVSDPSINPGTVTIDNANKFTVPLALGTDPVEPATTLTSAPYIASTLTVRGLEIANVTAGGTIPTEDDIACFIVSNGTDDIVVGSDAGISKLVTNTAVESVTLPASDNTLADTFADLYVDGDSEDDDDTVADIDFTNEADTNLFFANVDADEVLDNAIGTILDNANYKTLDSQTSLLVQVTDLADIDADGNGTDDNETTTLKRAEVSVAAGTLEPGSFVIVSSSDDSVTVPVLDNGSFKAAIRAGEDEQLTVQQIPTSNDPNAELQIRTIDVETSGSGFGQESLDNLISSTLYQRGDYVILLSEPDTFGFDFGDAVDADQVTINGVPVLKLTDGFYYTIVRDALEFTMEVNLNQNNAQDITVDINVQNANEPTSRRGISRLRVRERNDGRLAIKMASNRRFRTDTSVELIYNDGTTQIVPPSGINFSGSRRAIRVENPDPNKTIALIQVASTKGSRATVFNGFENPRR